MLYKACSQIYLAKMFISVLETKNNGSIHLVRSLPAKLLWLAFAHEQASTTLKGSPRDAPASRDSPLGSPHRTHKIWDSLSVFITDSLLCHPLHCSFVKSEYPYPVVNFRFLFNVEPDRQYKRNIYYLNFFRQSTTYNVIDGSCYSTR